ncbi:potassium-transporting ATPase subunit KdpC [Enterobacteriaceae bacterium 4M9]|nr:potassium-transporting ATPase subunit KdpC [Enterobacteriaceae bacterium 4M9]
MAMLRPAISLLLFMALVTGGLYPLLTTALAQWWFPAQANGSLIEVNGQIRGSALIGQPFSEAKYFQGRPSATAETPYNPQASGGSNLAASNPQLTQLVDARIAALRAANPQAAHTVPVELVTASASGLDPHITPAAARWQIARIAQTRSIAPEQVAKLIEAHTQSPAPGYTGQTVVNVLQLNLALDALKR